MRFTRLFIAPLIACGLVAMVSCSGGSLLPSSPEDGGGALVSASTSKAPRPMELIYCKPFDEASRTATIGIQGGTLTVGPHSLWIPPGALLSPRTITAKIAKNDYAHSVVLSPAGLKFAIPALLTLSYSGCNKETLLQRLQVVYTTDNLGRILELLPSLDNPFKKTTTGAIDHFSRYAVAF